MAELTKNFAVSTVATAPSPATSGTSLVVAAGEGARFDGAVDHNAVVCPANAQPTSANAEIVRVTAISTDTFTFVRAQEGSGARSIVVGDRIFAGPTVKTITDLELYADAAALVVSATKVPNTIVDAKGDLIAASANDTPARLAVGSNGYRLQADSNASTGVSWSPDLDWLPTGAKAQTFQKTDATSNSALLTSGTLRLQGGMVLRAGVTITSMSAMSATTALVTGSNQWFCLVDRSLNVLRKTADDTSTAWAANALKTLTLSSTYTPTVDIEVYFGILVVASTVPSLAALSLSTGVSAAGGGNAFAGNSTTGLTNPASLGATATAPTAGNPFWAFVS